MQKRGPFPIGRMIILGIVLIVLVVGHFMEEPQYKILKWSLIRTLNLWIDYLLALISAILLTLNWALYCDSREQVEDKE
ncbi:unnamed protein product [Adineta steineri]|uniref:Uncharacterized protein n=1 Tax=Adineta steineri TaxID=433720 RepID=A0A814DEL0_9BILA|nr:unnamed protein product [Adineta steineri]CAF1003387.1 unnamed protein product [Adineta steineri]CAF3798419.1 unnamed protein product [Adineta steineri]CAF3946973.1 unnamed protein product [Adineta steineri]